MLMLDEREYQQVTSPRLISLRCGLLFQGWWLRSGSIIRELSPEIDSNFENVLKEVESTSKEQASAMLGLR
jgi:hypothetical protein